MPQTIESQGIKFVKAPRTQEIIELLRDLSTEWEAQAKVLEDLHNDSRIILRAHFAADVAYWAAKSLQQDKARVVVAANEHDAFGVAVYRIMDDKSAIIDLVAVAPMHQPGAAEPEGQIRGIGTGMLCAVADDLAASGVTKVCLKPLDEAAETFWRNRGFTVERGSQLCVTDVPALASSCLSPECPDQGDCMLIGNEGQVTEWRKPSVRARLAKWTGEEYPEPREAMHGPLSGDPYLRNEGFIEGEQAIITERYPYRRGETDVPGGHAEHTEPFRQFLDRYIPGWQSLSNETMSDELINLDRQFSYLVHDYKGIEGDEVGSFSSGAGLFYHKIIPDTSSVDDFYVRYYPAGTAAFNEYPGGYYIEVEGNKIGPFSTHGLGASYYAWLNHTSVFEGLRHVGRYDEGELSRVQADGGNFEVVAPDSAILANAEDTWEYDKEGMLGRQPGVIYDVPYVPTGSAAFNEGSWIVTFSSKKDRDQGYPSWYRPNHKTYEGALQEAEKLAGWAGITLSQIRISPTATYDEANYEEYEHNPPLDWNNLSSIDTQEILHRISHIQDEDISPLEYKGKRTEEENDDLNDFREEIKRLRDELAKRTMSNYDEPAQLERGLEHSYEDQRLIKRLPGEVGARPVITSHGYGTMPRENAENIEPFSDFLDRYVPNWRNMTPDQRREELNDLQKTIQFEYDYDPSPVEEQIIQDWPAVEINNDNEELFEEVKRGFRPGRSDEFHFVRYYPRGTAAFAQEKKTTPEIEADKLEAMERPNIRSGRNAIDRLNRDDYDTEEADDLLTAYDELDRSDYDDAEEYTEARHEAWDEFIQAIREIDEAEAEEDEEEEPITPTRITHRVPTYAQLDSQTPAELVQMAEGHNIDVSQIQNRAGLIMAIRRAVATKRGLAVDSMGNVYDPATGRSVEFKGTEANFGPVTPTGIRRGLGKLTKQVNVKAGETQAEKIKRLQAELKQTRDEMRRNK